MPKALPYFKWFPSDAEGDNFYASLTDAEGWTYHRLLNRAWLNDGIPADLNEMARILGKPRSYVDRVWPKLSHRWMASPRNPAMLVNPRQEDEFQAALTKSTNNKRVGNANATRSRLKREPIVSIPAYESVSGVVDINSQKPRNKDPASEKKQYDPMLGWTAFKLGYPSHRINEYMDLRIWISVVDSYELEALILSKLPRFCQSVAWTEKRGKFVPKASKFLGEREFEMEPGPPPEGMLFQPEPPPKATREQELASLRWLAEHDPEGDAAREHAREQLRILESNDARTM